MIDAWKLWHKIFKEGDFVVIVTIDDKAFCGQIYADETFFTLKYYKRKSKEL